MSMSLAVPPAPPGRLVQEEARVREAEALLPWRGHVDQRAGARHPPGADHAHPRADEADQVVDGVPRLDVAALRVDEDGDVGLGLGGEGEELAGDGGGELLGDLAADDDGAGPQEALADGVGERGGRALGFVMAEHGCGLHGLSVRPEL